MNVDDGDVFDEGVAPIYARPDFRDVDWGTSLAKKHPPYVFAIRGASALVHRVAYVRLRWWIPIGSGARMAKLTRPRMIAFCRCGQFFRLEAKVSRTCIVPKPDALLCGRCHGEPATFGKHGTATKAGITQMVAHVKLGCVVAGYPGAMP